MFLRLFLLYTIVHLPLWSGMQMGVRERTDEQLIGIDVSHHQRRINWDTVVQRNNLNFAFVKATEGGDFTDSLFCHNWEALGRLGMPRGAYHFFRSRTNGYTQARHFLNTVDFQHGDLPPVLDVELTDGVQPHIMLEQMRQWLLTVERELHQKPIIYTNQHFYDKYLAGLFDHYPLWIARYSWEPPVLSTGRRWDFWQFSNEGHVEGIPGAVDLNMFPGNLEQFGKQTLQPDGTHPTQASTFAAP